MSDDEDEGYRPLREWTWLVLRGMFYGTVIVVMFPLLALFRADPRIDYHEDVLHGLDAGGPPGAPHTGSSPVSRRQRSS